MTEGIPLFTIGFTQKTAENFFALLRQNDIKKLVDTRLNNTGQLAGFSKRDDLQYFAKTIIGAEYIHWEESAPEEAMLNAYKKKALPWDEYAKEYEALMQRRRIESSARLILGHSACILCSEAKPHHCHRSLLANYLNRTSGGAFSVKHL